MGIMSSNPRTTLAGIGMIAGVLLKIFGPKLGLELDDETFNNIIFLLGGGGAMMGGDGIE